MQFVLVTLCVQKNVILLVMAYIIFTRLFFVLVVIFFAFLFLMISHLCLAIMSACLFLFLTFIVDKEICMCNEAYVVCSEYCPSGEMRYSPFMGKDAAFYYAARRRRVLNHHWCLHVFAVSFRRLPFACGNNMQSSRCACGAGPRVDL